MAANGNFSVFVVRCPLHYRSRRAMVPALLGPTRESHRACRPGGLAAPGVDAAAPPGQIAVALSHVQAPGAGGHVSRPRRAGHPLPGNIGDVSRNCQHDMSRNYQLGGRPACPVACLRAAAVGFRRAGAGASRRLTGAVRPRDPGDLVEGIGPLDFGLAGTRHWRGRRDLRSRCPAARRRPTAAGLPVARRDVALVARPCRSQARRLPAGAGPSRHGQAFVSPLPGASRPAAGASRV